MTTLLDEIKKFRCEWQKAHADTQKHREDEAKRWEADLAERQADRKAACEHREDEAKR